MPKVTGKGEKVVGSAIIMMVDARTRGMQPVVTFDRRREDRRATTPAPKPHR